MTASFLSRVKRHAKRLPPRIVVQAEHGVGKTEFGMSLPAPIFQLSEEGFGSRDVAHFEVAQSFGEVMQNLVDLYQQPHDFQSYVFDTIDWFEALVWAETCARHNVASIEEVLGGFGKGYLEAMKVWAELFAALDALRKDRGMLVCLLAHAGVVKFNDPEAGSYDRYEPKGNKRFVDKMVEWSDVTGYLTTKTYLVEQGQGFRKNVRGTTDGLRVMYVVEKPAFTAKNRYRLPEEIPMPAANPSGALLSAIYATFSAEPEPTPAPAPVVAPAWAGQKQQDAPLAGWAPPSIDDDEPAEVGARLMFLKGKILARDEAQAALDAHGGKAP